jgi:hypothetical protein
MDADIRAVKIKYFGQCPEYKSHDEGVFVLGMVTCFLICAVGAVIINYLAASNSTSDMIKHGCGSWAPTGQWTWTR